MDSSADIAKINLRNLKVNGIRSNLKQNPLINQRKNDILRKLQQCSLEKQSIQAESNQMTCSIQTDNPHSSKKMNSKNDKSFQTKYTIEEKIGQGAHGVVKKCISLKTKREYAVKILKMDDQQIAYLKKNFINIESLDHPSIIEYKGMYFEQKKSVCYLIMEYFPFPNLLQIQNISPEELKKIMVQVIETLVYLHKNKICHRDIKPENILYDRKSNKVKLIDFGISKCVIERGYKVSMLTHTGTLYYKAPQMFLGGGYDVKVDIWALGVTIYKIITNKTPFQSNYHNETIKNVLKGEIQFIDQIWEKYGFAKDLVSRLLRPLADRLSAQQAKKHIWFDSNILKEKDMINSMFFLQNPMKFNSMQQFLRNKSENMKNQKNGDIKKQIKMFNWLKQQYDVMDLTQSQQFN